MSIEVDWTFIVQSRLRMPLREYFRKAKVFTYEEAAEALRGAQLPVGTREEVVKHLPSSPDSNASSADSNPTSDLRASRGNKAIRGKSKKSKAPRSAAEAAADAITASAPVKNPEEKTPPKRSRKRKKS